MWWCNVRHRFFCNAHFIDNGNLNVLYSMNCWSVGMVSYDQMWADLPLKSRGHYLTWCFLSCSVFLFACLLHNSYWEEVSLVCGKLHSTDFLFESLPVIFFSMMTLSEMLLGALCWLNAEHHNYCETVCRCLCLNSVQADVHKPQFTFLWTLGFGNYAFFSETVCMSVCVISQLAWYISNSRGRVLVDT